MKTQVPEVTVEVLQAFADAWNRHDIDALMSFMMRTTVPSSLLRELTRVAPGSRHGGRASGLRGNPPNFYCVEK